MMADMDIDLYDDLDVIPNKYEQDKRDLEEKYAKVSLDYERVQQELEDIRTKYNESNKSESALKTLKANFDSLLLTAQSEIDRLKRQIDIVRKEKDDVLFRRVRPKTGSVKEAFTQTDSIRKVNYGVQTDTALRDRKEPEERKNDRNRLKRLRSQSRSREKSSRSSSKQSASENERKRSRNDERDNGRRDTRRRSRERKPQERTIATRKSTRLSEETTKDEKCIRIKVKRKSRTPKKANKKDLDPVEQELQMLMSEQPQNKLPDRNPSKLDTTQDLRSLLEAKKGELDVFGNRKGEKKETEKKSNGKKVEEKPNVDCKTKKSPLELLWQERQVEAVPDESQNTSDLFGNQIKLSLSTKDTENTQQQQILNDLYSDSESTLSKVCPLKINCELEDGEIVDDVPVENKEQRKSPEKKVASANKRRTPSRKLDKKSISKVVPGTVDDSACDLGEIIQKQSSMVQNDPEEKVVEEVLAVTEEPLEKIVEAVPSKLIEISDLVDETTASKKSSPSSLIGQKSMESILMSNQELFGDQSNISLLIAADIFLQNENTMKSTDKKPPVSPSESNFNGFSSQDSQPSPRNNSNDSLKENICTPITNNLHNACHSHGATPKTMSKSEPKQLLTQLNNGPDSSVPTPDTSKDITAEPFINTTANTSKCDDSLNSSAKRKVIETKSTHYVMEETDDMVICTVTRKKRKKEKKEKKSKHKHKDRERTSLDGN